MQKKKHSLFEALSNTLAGILISYAVSFFIYPLLGMDGDAASYAAATLFFTALSIGRNYFVRRGFNWIHYGETK